MADKVPLVDRNKARLVRGNRGLNRMTQMWRLLNFHEFSSSLELVGGSSSGLAVAPSKGENNRRVCRPERVAWKDPRQ